jgi:hypothetical protein
MVHKVATRHHGRLLYEFATDFTSFHHKDKMYHIQTNSLDLLVTENHRMFVGRQTADRRLDQHYHAPTFMTPKEIFGEAVRYEKSAINSTGPLLHIYDVDISEKYMEVFLNLYGWLINRGYRSGNNIYITTQVTTSFQSIL